MIVAERSKLVFRMQRLKSPLLFFGLMLTKLIALGFGLFVYAKVTTLGDSQRYLTASVDISLAMFSDRTLFADGLFSLLRSLLGSDFLVHFSVSIASALLTYFLVRKNYEFSNKVLLWGALLQPHFLIWTSIVGKEAIAIGGFFLVVKWCVDMAVYGRARWTVLILGLAVGLLMRPHYAVGYLLVACSSWVMARSPVAVGVRFSVGALAAALSLLASLLLIGMAATHFVWVDWLQYLMEVSQRYFLSYDAGSNRYWIPWGDSRDFFLNAWWGVPLSWIGPTVGEALSRPMFMPVLVEGLLSLFLMAACAYALVGFACANPKYRMVIVFAFMPAVAMALAAHYPFGLFNPGSAIRYKQSLAPLVYFYPLLLMAEHRRAVMLDRGRSYG